MVIQFKILILPVTYNSLSEFSENVCVLSVIYSKFPAGTLHDCDPVANLFGFSSLAKRRRIAEFKFINSLLNTVKVELYKIYIFYVVCLKSNVMFNHLLINNKYCKHYIIYIIQRMRKLQCSIRRYDDNFFFTFFLIFKT